MKNKRIEISYKTIIFTIIFLLGLVLLWQIRNLVVLLFISFVFMEALNPAVVKLERFKIPRPLAILILYTILLTVISFVIAGIIPILVEQTTGLIQTLPDTLSNIKIFGTNAIDFSSQFKILENIPGSIAKTVISIGSNIFSAFIFMFITFYLLLEKKNFPKYGQNAFGESGKEKMITIIEQLENRLGSWVNAQIFLMLIIGVISYIGYSILGLKYALPLAIIAGLLEAVPSIGPIIATVLAALVGLIVSPLTCILAIIVGIVIQQLENNIIVPRIMKQTIGLNPLITILLISAGAKIGGVMGAIIAIPIFLTTETIIKVFMNKK